MEQDCGGAWGPGKSPATLRTKEMVAVTKLMRFVYLFICLFIYLFIYLFVCLFNYLSIYLFIHNLFYTIET